MKVLLIQANILNKKSPLLNPRVYPLGLSYVGTALKLKGHQVEIFDPTVVQEPFAALAEKIAKIEPEVVGLSLRHLLPSTGPAIEWCRQLVKEVKKNSSSKVKILIGGPAFSLYAEKLMKHLPEIDYGVLYEGEESTPELLENLENPEMTKGLFLRKGGQVIFTGQRKKIDFGAFPMPRRDLVDMRMYLDQPYIVGVQTKRGCILRCIYCGYPMLDGTTLRLRSPKYVVDEIEHLTKFYDVKSITFTDNVFNIPLQHAEQICREMVNRKVDVRWTAWFHEKYITRQFMELARDAGCDRVEFSPDGFSDRTLKNLGKNMTKNDVMRVYHIVKGMKEIEVRYNFFLWPPGQTIMACLGLIWFKVKAEFTLGRRLLGFRLGRIAIIENTKLQEIAVKKGIIKEDTDLLLCTSHYWGSGRGALLFRVKRAFGKVFRHAKLIIFGCLGKSPRRGGV